MQRNHLCYVAARRNAKAAARKSKSKQAERAVEQTDNKRLFSIAKQRAREQLDVTGSNFIKGNDGKLHVPGGSVETLEKSLQGYHKRRERVRC